MYTQITSVLAIAAFAQSQPQVFNLGIQQPLVLPVSAQPAALPVLVQDYYHHPHYNYGYGVHDHHTGDHKSQQEGRTGDAVRGSYSFLQPDGRVRIVNYVADGLNGFNAQVQYVAPTAPVVPVGPVNTAGAVPVAQIVAGAPALFGK